MGVNTYPPTAEMLETINPILESSSVRSLDASVGIVWKIVAPQYRQQAIIQQDWWLKA